MTQPWAPPLLVTPQRDVVITPQQANVLSGMCCGHTYDRIASNLGIARNTVLTHARHMYKAMGASCGRHAIALACTQQVRVMVGYHPPGTKRPTS